MRVYRRSARLTANLMVVSVALLAVWLGRDLSTDLALLLAVLVAVCVIYYGYFISSQSCSRCGEPFTSVAYGGLWLWATMLFVFCHVPKRCESCGNDAKW